jgi:energy-coupling factor transporter transmembrane protein EcfT
VSTRALASPSAAGRLLATLVVVGGVATAPLPERRTALVLAAVVAAAALGWARPRLAWLWRRALAASLAVTALTIPFVLAGRPDRAAEVGVRAGLALTITLASASRLELRELPVALVSLRVPRELASTLHALLWQLEHVADEGRRLLLARRLRGATGVIGPEVLSALFARTTLRAERVELAVALRGSDPLGERRALSRLDLGITAVACVLAWALHVTW